MTEERSRGFWWGLLRVGLAVVGLGVTAKILGREGLEGLRAALPSVVSILPLCLLLELGRVGFESLATRSAAGPIGARIPIPRLLAAHLVAYAVLTVAPAPRAVAEATKAALFARYVGAAQAAAIGTIVQAGTFVGVGLMSGLASVAVLWKLHGGPLGPLLVGNAVGLLALGLGMGVAVRSPWLRSLASRRLAGRFDVEGTLARFHAVFARSPFVMVAPGLWLLCGMICQVVEIGLVAGALSAGISVAGAFAAHGVHLISATAAVMIPGQFGAREVAFAMAAEALGTIPAVAASVALVWHGVQLSLACAGFVVLALWRHRER